MDVVGVTEDTVAATESPADKVAAVGAVGDGEVAETAFGAPRHRGVGRQNTERTKDAVRKRFRVYITVR